MFCRSSVVGREGPSILGSQQEEERATERWHTSI